MEFSTTTNGDTLSISFRGNFGFSDNTNAQSIMAEMTDSSSSVCAIDLSGLESIDSAGLGMLLLLNDAAEGDGKKLELHKPSGQVEKMLQISKFSEFMSINP